MKKVLKKKITGLIVICSMLLTVVAFPVAVSAAELTFDPAGGKIGDKNAGESYECNTEERDGKQYIKADDASLVFGASKEGYRLKCWNIAGKTGQQISFYDISSLCAHEFLLDTALTAEWEKCITLIIYGVIPTNEQLCFINEVSEGYAITEESVHQLYPDRNGYTVIGLEYAGKGGNDGDRYEYGTQINEDTALRLRWKKAYDTPTRPDPSGGGGGGPRGGGGGGPRGGGGGGPRGGGGGAPNPKTGDLGIAPYVGIVTISALGTAGVVKLLKKEK